MRRLIPTSITLTSILVLAACVNCDDNPFTLTVISNSGSVAFDFL